MSCAKKGTLGKNFFLLQATIHSFSFDHVLRQLASRLGENFFLLQATIHSFSSDHVLRQLSSLQAWEERLLVVAGHDPQFFF
jgi:hypothetical protein